MKVINIMNFVRYIDERMKDSVNILYQTTKQELELVNEFGFEHTFLLQYDAICGENYQKLFREQGTERTELGLWYEIVEPLTTACGLPYRSERGWKWDWHIIPGFSMAYTPKEREMLVDEAMRKFKEVFGYYPKTFASWLLDTHTVNYLCEHYGISAFAICRDQVNTDAYTLIGGYFNQAYYPSKNNLFTPAQTDEMRNDAPIFRLLGPCPIHNYEGQKYLSENIAPACFTLEPVGKMGKTPECVDWMFRTYFENEDLGFSYAQIGQENSFGFRVIEPLRMQLEKIAQLKNVEILKMCDTGEAFKRMYPNKTPATAVTALDNWDTEDIQSVYYDCENYVSNLMRWKNQIFIRSLFLFDERVEENYLSEVCKSFDAVYENLPMVNNLLWSGEEKCRCGIVIDENATSFQTKKCGEGSMEIAWDGGSVIYDEEKITVHAKHLQFYIGNPTADVSVRENRILYSYKGHSYALEIQNADLKRLENGDISISAYDGCCVLTPKRM